MRLLYVFSFVLFVLFVLFPSVVLAQPCPPVDVNLNVDEQVQQWWMVLLDFLVQISAPLVTCVLSVLGTWVVRKLTKKWDVEKQEAFVRLVDGFVVSGVAFAEEQARKSLKVDRVKTEGADKLQSAVDYVQRQISSSGVHDIATEELEKLIESRLQMERVKPDGIVPNEPESVLGSIEDNSEEEKNDDKEKSEEKESVE